MLAPQRSRSSLSSAFRVSPLQLIIVNHSPGPSDNFQLRASSEVVRGVCLVPSADSRAGPCIVILLIENVFVTCHMRRAPRASIKNTYIIQQRVHKYSVFRPRYIPDPSLKRQNPGTRRALHSTTHQPSPALHSQPFAFPVWINIEGRAPCKSSNPLSTVFLFRWPPPAVVMDPPRAQISIK